MKELKNKLGDYLPDLFARYLESKENASTDLDTQALQWEDFLSEEIDGLVALFSQELEEAKTQAHMQGFHEGRAAANNPEYQYSYTSGVAQKGKNTTKENT